MSNAFPCCPITGWRSCCLRRRNHGRAGSTSTLTMLRLRYEGSVQGRPEHTRGFQASVHGGRRSAVHIACVSAVVHRTMASGMTQNGTHASAHPSMTTRFHKATLTGETVLRMPPALTWAHAVGLRALRNTFLSRAFVFYFLICFAATQLARQ